MLTDFPVDGCLGIAAAGFIFTAGRDSFRANLNLLLGKDLSGAEKEEIRGILLVSGIFENADDAAQRIP
jgi:divalent metal cation (Fe/Co/Zn/Cd) transporter